MFTDHIDQLIREAYLSRPVAKTRPGIRLVAKKVGAFGIDPHPVIRWINKGRLKATFRGTVRGEAQNGDIYLIHEKDLRRFVLKHPAEIDLAKWTSSGFSI